MRRHSLVRIDVKAALIDEVFAPEKAGALRRMFVADPDAKPLVLRVVGQAVLESDALISGRHALNALICVCMNAPFDFDDEEPVTVAAAVFSQVARPAITPSVFDDLLATPRTPQAERSFCARVLVCLSFFLRHMEKRQRRGAPPPSYYRGVACMLWRRSGKIGMAEHHRAWESHLAEMLAG